MYKVVLLGDHMVFGDQYAFILEANFFSVKLVLEADLGLLQHPRWSVL